MKHQITHSKEVHYGKIDFTDDRIFIITLKDGSVIEKSDIDDLKLYFDSVIENKPFAILTYSPFMTMVSPDAMEYLSKNPHPLRLAVAFVHSNLSTRLMANFFIRLVKGDKNSKAFGEFDKAYLFLKNTVWEKVKFPNS